jgi:hypothetical protein
MSDEHNERARERERVRRAHYRERHHRCADARIAQIDTAPSMRVDIDAHTALDARAHPYSSSLPLELRDSPLSLTHSCRLHDRVHFAPPAPCILTLDAHLTFLACAHNWRLELDARSRRRLVLPAALTDVAPHCLALLFTPLSHSMHFMSSSYPFRAYTIRFYNRTRDALSGRDAPSAAIEQANAMEYGIEGG